MRVVSFTHAGQSSFGLHADDGIVDAGRRLDYPDLRALLAASALDDLQRLAAQPADLEHSAVRYLPVVPNAPRIFCVGANYFEHMKEAGREPPEFPWIFMRSNASLVGHLQPLLRPRESETFDWEVELCAVIGTPGRRVNEEDALQLVAGYSVFNDGSIRAYQRQSPLWIQGKNFDSSGAMGPWLVPAGEIDTGFEMRMRTRLNGEVMQDDIVNRWHFSLPAVIAYISRWTALQPGDVIAMGTPSGVGFARNPPVWMRPGDVVEVEIEGIGTLVNPVAAD